MVRITHSLRSLKDRITEVSLKSRSQKLKVGAFLLDEIVEDLQHVEYEILSYGFNHLSVELDETIYGPQLPEEGIETKMNVVHAEFALLKNLFARNQTVTDMSSKVIALTHFPCYNCCKLIEALGIKKLIIFNLFNDEFHDWDFKGQDKFGYLSVQAPSPFELCLKNNIKIFLVKQNPKYCDNGLYLEEFGYSRVSFHAPHKNTNGFHFKKILNNMFLVHHQIYKHVKETYHEGVDKELVFDLNHYRVQRSFENFIDSYQPKNMLPVNMVMNIPIFARVIKNIETKRSEFQEFTFDFTPYLNEVTNTEMKEAIQNILSLENLDGENWIKYNQELQTIFTRFVF